MVIMVKMGDGAVSNSPNIIATSGCGSCLALVLYDAKRKVGGLAHIMLPSKTFEAGVGSRESEKRWLGIARKENSQLITPNSKLLYQYADSAIPALINEMIMKGASIKNMSAKIAGGSKMFLCYSLITPGIGRQNIEMAKKVLEENRIPLIGWDVGGRHGRSVDFYLDTGRVVVKAFEREDKEI